MDKLNIYKKIWGINGKIKDIKLNEIRKLFKDFGQGI